MGRGVEYERKEKKWGVQGEKIRGTVEKNWGKNNEKPKQSLGEGMLGRREANV